MFFGKSRIRIFKTVSSIVNSMERIKKGNTINIVQCSKC